MSKLTALTWIVSASVGAIASSCNYLFEPIQYGLDSCFFLPNGYTYQTVNMHHIKKGKWGGSGGPIIATFSFGNRIYINERYVVGEVRPPGVNLDDPNLEDKYEYFILDTEADTYSGEMSQSDWQEQLRKLDIADEVKLVPRSGKLSSEMWKRYGRGKQC